MKEEAHEQRIKERNHENDSEQALQAKFSKKSSGQGSFQKKLKSRWKNDKVKNQEGAIQEFGSVSQKFNMQDQALRRNKKRLDKRKVQCFNCKNFGHYAAECRFKHGNGGPEIEARMAQGDDSGEEQVLLMVTIEKEQAKTNCWYLDTCCSNHMAGHKDWFVSLDGTAKSRVKFADHSSIEAEEIGDISIQRKDAIQEQFVEPWTYARKRVHNVDGRQDTRGI
ncbi:PREDICTED: uncharacterized protein LOC109352900 [Lupinus angustifolius]|uniref:uncharacterized protein LOC109352900 n=1 Tax=Lupinus angustifolius TaxID=3871 RepID=UPI00092FD82A|nr:PREDICTED: uncharacterized protein LOC109352900 [Lupinus angustifolius]